MTNFTLDQNKLNYSEVFTNAESGNQQLRYKVGDKLIEENTIIYSQPAEYKNGFVCSTIYENGFKLGISNDNKFNIITKNATDNILWSHKSRNVNVKSHLTDSFTKETTIPIVYNKKLSLLSVQSENYSLQVSDITIDTFTDSKIVPLGIGFYSFFISSNELFIIRNKFSQVKKISFTDTIKNVEIGTVDKNKLISILVGTDAGVTNIKLSVTGMKINKKSFIEGDIEACLDKNNDMFMFNTDNQTYAKIDPFGKGLPQFYYATNKLENFVPMCREGAINLVSDQNSYVLPEIPDREHWIDSLFMTRLNQVAFEIEQNFDMNLVDLEVSTSNMDMDVVQLESRKYFKQRSL